MRLGWTPPLEPCGANAAEELLRPTRTVVHVMDFERVMTYESVEFNTVDETVYALPEAVKALVKPKPSTPSDEN